MFTLVLGLVLFLGVHSVRVWGEGLRSRLLGQLGEGPWKGAYSLASLLGFVLIVVGYGQARTDPVVLWALPVGVRHLASLLVLVAFVFLAAAYVPGNRLKPAVGHPMLLGTKVWAFAHLLANGTLADLVLFGGFLGWAIVTYASCRRRDRRAGVTYPPGRPAQDLLLGGVALALWVGFAFYLHAALFGVSPFG